MKRINMNKLSANINLMNGNPNCWKTANDLTDEEVQDVLEDIGNVNNMCGAGLLDQEEECRVQSAIEYAEKGKTEREYIARWTHIYGNLIIG